MDILRPSFTILKRYYRAPEHNLKYILSHFLDNETGADTTRHLHQGITRTVYGVIRRESMLDHIIEQLIERKPGKIEREVLILLRIGVFLLIFSDSYPGYAVVNETVRAAKNKAKGFVNAVLRRCAKDKETIKKSLETIEYPHITHSISRLLVDNLKALSPDLNAGLEYLDREPLFHVRVNKNAFGYDEVKQVLTRNELVFHPLERFNSFAVEGAGGAGVVLRELLKEKKYFYFQNTASQLVSTIAAQFAKKTVLDCCAAPGTKSVTLSMLRPGLTVIANDIDWKRISQLNEFCEGYGLESIHSMVSDGRQLGVKAGFDFIILDAPCTSSGTLRKNPDLKLKIDMPLVRKNAAIQNEILQNIINDFPGAYILYSVCSFIKEETEDVLASRSPGLETVDLSPILDKYGFKYKKAVFGFYLLPDQDMNNDLFYISLLKRPEGPNPHVPRTLSPLTPCS